MYQKWIKIVNVNGNFFISFLKKIRIDKEGNWTRSIFV
jgi:hypothetical protein